MRGLERNTREPLSGGRTGKTRPFSVHVHPSRSAPILLAGNHDPDEEFSLLKLQGGRFYALHGHALFKEVAPWGWEYLKNKHISRELIAAFPDADADLCRRLELARA